MYLIEILHQTTTDSVIVSGVLRLYLIEILHQTTTGSEEVPSALLLYLIEILHQTTTVRKFGTQHGGCILLKFYIKPQLEAGGVPNWSRCILLKFYIKPQLERE